MTSEDQNSQDSASVDSGETEQEEKQEDQSVAETEEVSAAEASNEEQPQADSTDIGEAMGEESEETQASVELEGEVEVPSEELPQAEPEIVLEVPVEAAVEAPPSEAIVVAESLFSDSSALVESDVASGAEEAVAEVVMEPEVTEAVAASEEVVPEDTVLEETSVEESDVAEVVAEAATEVAPIQDEGISDVVGDSEAAVEIEGAPAEETEIAEETETAEEIPEEPPKPVNPNFRWFVVHAYSGYEMKAKKALEEKITARGMQEYFGEVHVPQETVVELVRGQKKTSNRKYFPGYILVQMEMNQDTWHLVKETPKISGFVGDATDPVPMSQEEVERIMSQVAEGAASPRARMKFEQGQAVKVVDGPFTDFNGTVEEVKPEKGKIKVLISIFGRATPVELDFIQVEKC